LEHTLIDREWVTLVDPEDDHRRYTFDVSFLLSDYTCIFGRGCQGITGRPVLGCCSHGAYLNEDDDGAALERLVLEDLDETTMQFHRSAVRKGVLSVDDEGDTHTRVVEGGCIFANREGFAAGEGCALHHLAVRRGEDPMTYKPTVCWQVPLHRTIDEKVGNDGRTVEVHSIAAFERGDWGEGGADFSWWCFDDDVAFVGEKPLFRSMERELRIMVGNDVYDELAAYLEQRAGSAPRIAFLPII
jgi:hypothetical protein